MSTIRPSLNQLIAWLKPLLGPQERQAASHPSRFKQPASRLLVAALVLATLNPVAAQPVEEDANGSTIKRNAASDERSFDAVKIRSNNTSIDLTERFSKDLEFAERITKVDGHDPDVISVAALSPSSLRIRGLTQGVTTMIVTGASAQKFIIEVYVGGDARLLQSVLKRAFPDSAITCRALQGDSMLLTGYVTDNQTITQIMDIARVYSGNVINHIRVGGPQEVQLRVKILEVQRSKLRQFGVDFLAATQSAVIASSPGSIAPISGLISPLGGGAPIATMTPSTSNPTSLGLGFAGDNFAFTMFIQALKTEGLLKVMTEPVLVVRSGEAARLSDGGEFPIPVPGGLGTVTIEFREFGVILETLPIVISPTRVKQQVTAEVSGKDNANSITLLGTTVPGITKRRVQSTVDMNFGDTMVIGGLISTRVEGTYLKTPLLGEVPVLGAMFSKKQLLESEIELIVLVTPEYGSAIPPGQLPPGGPGMFTTSPTDREMYRDGLLEVPNYGTMTPPTVPYRGPYDRGMGAGVGGNCAPGGAPVITPGPSGNQNPDGLIGPPGTGPQAPIPPSPTADSAGSRRFFSSSSWAMKSRSANSAKSKDTSSSTDFSSIEPAGFQNQQKTGRYSNSQYQKRKSDEQE